MGTEKGSHLELLSLVQQYGNEERVGEHALEDLKKRRLVLTSQVETAVQELERLKKVKFCTEEEFKSLNIELKKIESALKVQQDKGSILQDQIDQATSELENLQNEYTTKRDTFIDTLRELHLNLRQIQSECGKMSMEPESDSNCKMLDVGDNGKSFQEALLALHSEIETQTEKQYQVLLREKTRFDEAIADFSREIAKLRSESAEKEEEVAWLTTTLQNLYKCPKCECDNLSFTHGSG